MKHETIPCRITEGFDNEVDKIQDQNKYRSRRYNHRANIGIALLQKLTGQVIGRLMLNVMLDEIKKLGFEQAELIVIDHNDRAKHLYESMGFKECGRYPNANKYDDGTYADDILMVKNFI